MHNHLRFEAQFSAVLERIHHAPLTGEGSSWQDALTAVANFVGSTACDLNFFDATSFAYKRWEHARIDAQTIERYAAGFMSDMRNAHPRVPVVVRMDENELFADSDLWSTAERNRVPFFAEVNHPAGLYDALTACVQKGGADDELIILGNYLDHKAEVPSAETRGRVRLLLPHLKRAIATEKKLAQVRHESSVLAEALDQVSEAVAMLDWTGKVVRANRLAHEIFRTGSVCLTAYERLALPTSETQSTLERSLGQCASPLILSAGHDAGPPIPIVVHRPDTQPLILTLQPLPRNLAGTFGAIALMFIRDLAAKPANRSALLQAAYGLTATEARLMQGLSNGALLKDYAARNRITYETARTHLRRIFEKTGARRQSDLVRIVRALR